MVRAQELALLRSPPCMTAIAWPASCSSSSHTSRIFPKDFPLSRCPCHPQWEQLTLWLWELCFRKPNGCAFGSRTPSMWPPSLVLWTKQTMEWLFGVRIFLHQRDKLWHSPFVLRLLLHSSVFNLFVSREFLMWSLCHLMICCVILCIGDLIFLWAGKRKWEKDLRL